MSSHAHTPDSPISSAPGMQGDRRSMRRMAMSMLVPVVVYGLARPYVSSDALGLAIAGAVPILYSILLAVSRRRIDSLVLLSASGFLLACMISLLTGGSSLPLKLHEALITFTLGLVLLIATLIRRPVPLGGLLRVPSATKQIDSALGVMIGGFLVLHASLVMALAVSLPTSSYLVLSKVIGWGTLAAGGFALSVYLRRVRADTSPEGCRIDR
jgi:hypothetical protein